MAKFASTEFKFTSALDLEQLEQLPTTAKLTMHVVDLRKTQSIFVPRNTKLIYLNGLGTSASECFFRQGKCQLRTVLGTIACACCTGTLNHTDTKF